MLSQELVLKHRTQILHALCSSGSTEPLDRVLDILLAQGELVWEDYQNIHVPGRALYASARQLLDLVSIKGVNTCVLFLAALKQVLPDAHTRETIPVLGFCSDLETHQDAQRTCTQTLLAQRPSLVARLQDCVDDALDTLVVSGHLTPAECEDVQLPIHTPSQKARRLLDHVRSKGEVAAEILLQYIQQKCTSGSPVTRERWKTPKEFFKYRQKLSSSLAAQSCVLSTYGGTSHMSLEDIYTEGQLELPRDCPGDHRCLGLEDIIGAVGTVNQEADTVLVSGDAGSGKSTLLQRLHLLWAQGSAFQNFLLLFTFSCRRLNSEQTELSVKDLLFQHCCWPDREQDDIFQFILDHPHLILFTFDGLDELKHSFSDERSFCCPTQCAPVAVLLFNLLQGCLMKGVQKIVTSRPEAVGPALKKHLRKEILLKGFSPVGITCFVRKHHSDPSVAAKVLESLQTNTALLGLCHSPVLCWIVSQCHKELLGCGDGSPQTITDIYLMILQHFLQHKSPHKDPIGFEWIQEHQKTVLHLGKLAFEGLRASCYVFTGPEMEACGITEKDISAGFLSQSTGLWPVHTKAYEFLHVTLQCFFAALYIVVSTDTDNHTILRLFEPHAMEETNTSSTCFGVCLPSVEHQRQVSEREAMAAQITNLQMTAIFLSGLLSRRHRGLWINCCPHNSVEKKVKGVMRCISKSFRKHFKSIPQPVGGENKSMHAMPGFVWLVKCIYEMQESSIAKDAMNKLDLNHLKLTYCNIGPVECTALAFVLQHLRKPVGLQLDYNSVGDVGLEQLLPCMPVCYSLYLRNNNITDVGISKLIAKCIHCDNFQKIALFNNMLTDACTQHFSQLLMTKQNFIALRLGNNNITAEGAKQLAQGLKSNHSLQYLGLWGNKIGDVGAEALANALENSKTLVWLSLAGNGVGNAGACALANIIKNSTSLEDLWLSDNCITKTGAECLIQALEHNTHVKTVWLKNNNLSVEEVEEMAQRESRLIL